MINLNLVQLTLVATSVATTTGVRRDRIQQHTGGKQRLAIGIITVRAHRQETTGFTMSTNTMTVYIPRAMVATTGWMDSGGRSFPS